MPLPIDPMLLREFIISQLPTLISQFGRDPLARSRKEYQDLYSSGRFNKLLNEDYSTVTRSPGYTMARNYAIAGSSALTNSVNRNLAARGLDSTAIGAIAGPLAQTGLSRDLGNIDTSAFSTAMDLALKRREGMAKVFQNENGQISFPYGPSRGGAAFGSGLNAFMPVLRDWFARRDALRLKKAKDIGSQVDLGWGPR